MIPAISPTLEPTTSGDSNNFYLPKFWGRKLGAFKLEAKGKY
jgi:hypothetical protein